MVGNGLWVCVSTVTVGRFSVRQDSSGWWHELTQWYLVFLCSDLEQTWSGDHGCLL